MKGQTKFSIWHEGWVEVTSMQIVCYLLCGLQSEPIQKILDFSKFLFSRDFSSLSWNGYWLLSKKFANKHIINHKFWFTTDLIIHTVYDWPDGLNGILGIHNLWIISYKRWISFVFALSINDYDFYLVAPLVFRWVSDC